MQAEMWVLRMVREQHHRDDEGRPIREGRTPRDLLRPGEIELKQCPFAGSRFQHANPMNVSALRQTSEHWDDVAGCLAFLRELYTEAHGGYGPDILDIWRVSQLGSSLPWWWILRGQTAPAYAANLSKVMLGAGVWGQRLFAKMLLERWVAPAQITSQQIVDFAEETGTLVGDTEVCSAPATMMIDFFDILTTPPQPHACPLAADKEPFLLFAAHYTAFKQLVHMYYLARRFLYADIFASRGMDAELETFVTSGCEPPDFFIVEPADPSALALSHRGAWFSALGQLIQPMAPDGSDAALREAAVAIGTTMANPTPPRLAEVSQEVADPRIARAVAHYLELDAIIDGVMRTVEAGFRQAGGAEPFTGAIDGAMRDSFLNVSPRPYFARMAPRAVAASDRTS